MIEKEMTRKALRYRRYLKRVGRWCYECKREKPMMGRPPEERWHHDWITYRMSVPADIGRGTLRCKHSR